MGAEVVGQGLHVSFVSGICISLLLLHIILLNFSRGHGDGAWSGSGRGGLKFQRYRVEYRAVVTSHESRVTRLLTLDSGP